MSVTVGPIVFYPLRSAMHGAVNVSTRWGYVCFKPPTYVFGCWWPWYVYVSPNATPWAATWAIGPHLSTHDREHMEARRKARRFLRESVEALDHEAITVVARHLKRGERFALDFKAKL